MGTFRGLISEGEVVIPTDAAAGRPQRGATRRVSPQAPRRSGQHREARRRSRARPPVTRDARVERTRRPYGSRRAGGGAALHDEQQRIVERGVRARGARPAMSQGGGAGQRHEHSLDRSEPVGRRGGGTSRPPCTGRPRGGRSPRPPAPSRAAIRAQSVAACPLRTNQPPGSPGESVAGDPPPPMPTPGRRRGTASTVGRSPLCLERPADSSRIDAANPPSARLAWVSRPAGNMPRGGGETAKRGFGYDRCACCAPAGGLWGTMPAKRAVSKRFRVLPVNARIYIVQDFVNL